MKRSAAKLAMTMAAMTVMVGCGMNPMDIDPNSNSGGDANQGLYEMVKISVEDGSAHVRTDVSIDVEFPRPVDRGFWNEENIFLIDIEEAEALIGEDEKSEFFAGICDANRAVPSSVRSSDGVNLTLQMHDALKEGTVYALCILDSILYEDGDLFPGMVISFKTMTPKRVRVAMTSPAEEGTAASLSESIKIIFDGRIELSQLAYENFELVSEDGILVEGELSYKEFSPVSQIFFEPDDDLIPGTRYFAKFSGAFEDLNGECLAGRNGDGDCNEFIHEWSFVAEE